jgi:hypothetical protein
MATFKIIDVLCAGDSGVAVSAAHAYVSTYRCPVWPVKSRDVVYDVVV